MNRRAFLASLAALAACSSGGGSRPAGGSPGVIPVPPPPPLGPEPLLGINIQPATALTMLPHVEELRIRHVRASWWWWSSLEEWAWLPAYRAAGIEVLPLIYGGPLLRAAARYELLRGAFGPFPWIQVENEPDHEGTAGPEGRLFGGYLLNVAEDIKARDPETRICAAGLGWTQPGVRGFLGGMLEVAGERIDAVSLHTYGHHPHGEPLSRWRIVREMGWQGEIWCTELGQSHEATRAYLAAVGAEATPAALDAHQEECWRVALSEDEGRRGWRRIYPFQLGYDEKGYGILREDGSSRPAYEWLRNR